MKTNTATFDRDQQQLVVKAAAKYIAGIHIDFSEHYKKECNYKAQEINISVAKFFGSVSNWEFVPMSRLEQIELKLHKWIASWSKRIAYLEDRIALTGSEHSKQALVDVCERIEKAQAYTNILSPIVEQGYASNDTIESGTLEGDDVKPYDTPDGVSRGTHELADEDTSEGPLFSR